jgi:hypothetical protein
MYLDQNYQYGVYSGYFNNTAPTSSVFTLGSDSEVNSSGDTHIAYCFAEVEGYSKFGQYTGNGSTDGPFVYCGFKPSFIVTKITDGTNDRWQIQDSTRTSYNGYNYVIKADVAEVEESNSTWASLDFLSNGFKWRYNDTSNNGNGYKYLFMAFAENPFGGDGVSPATAR